MGACGQHVEAERHSICLNHAPVWMSSIPLMCKAPSLPPFPFLSLWPSPPSPFRIQTLISQGLCLQWGPNTLGWLFPLHSLCSVLWTCLSLSDFGRRISAQLCALGDHSFLPVCQYPLWLWIPESLPTTCPWVVAWTQSCQLLLPAYSYLCFVRQGHLGSRTLCVMCMEVWQIWVWCKTV